MPQSALKDIRHVENLRHEGKLQEALSDILIKNKIKNVKINEKERFYLFTS